MGRLRFVLSKQKILDVLSLVFLFSVFSIMILAAIGCVNFAVTSTNSMGPSFPPGALAVFARQDSYSVGDVVLFKIHGALLAHRIAAETERGFKTKGDANAFTDPWIVPPSAVRGKLIFSIPFLGTIVMVLRFPAVFAGLSTALFATATWHEFFCDPTEATQKSK